MIRAMEQDVGHIPLRPPSEVMRLERMGSFHKSRLSFMQVLLRRMRAENWSFERPVFEIDAKGEGVAVYAAHTGTRVYSLICFAHDLPDELRSDRVIAEAWDATFTLFDGVPGAADIARLRANVPLQEAGRITSRELTLARANRSVRLFAHVLDALSEGRQPDANMLGDVGYLMRTTAVYGSGKFGACDRENIADRPEFSSPFQVEMLTVFLIRAFVADLVEAMAAARAPATAVPMAPDLRRMLGVGNSTGLGMAPFLINHPVLLNNWMVARETALARVRAEKGATAAQITAFRNAVAEAAETIAQWHSAHPIQQDKLAQLRVDMPRLAAEAHGDVFGGNAPWNRLYLWAQEHLSVEGQELVVSLLLDPFPELVDGLAPCMSADEAAFARIDGAMGLDELRGILEDVYGWALAIDWSAAEADARAWYVSQEKLEPRLGERHDEPIAAFEQPLSPGRDAVRMMADLKGWTGDDTLAAFLMHHPQHRHMARRAQIAQRCPYGEIRDNTIGADLLPIDILRCKLSFFGATHFDPRSDRWVRINMFQDAPYPVNLMEAR